MKNFFLKLPSEKSQIFKDMRDSYSMWKDKVFNMNKPFFAIHSDFQNLFLKELSGPALKLYIFLGLNSRYQSGESWFSSKDIANFFDKDQRTVANWFMELEEIGLIAREQKGFKMKANSFLRPYGFMLDEIELFSDANIDNLLNDIVITLDLGRSLKYGLILNYALKEFTFVLISQKEQVFYCSCFLRFEESQVKNIKEKLKNYNIPVDNFDIDAPIASTKNKKLTIYNHILRYIKEEQS